MHDVLSGSVYQETEFPGVDVRTIYVLVVLDRECKSGHWVSILVCTMYVSCPGLFINRCHVRTLSVYQDNSRLVRECISGH